MVRCNDCEALGARVYAWNALGARDPLPAAKPLTSEHAALALAGRGRDGAEGPVLLFRCVACSAWWSLFLWVACGVVELTEIDPLRSEDLVACAACGARALALGPCESPSFTDWTCRSCAARWRVASDASWDAPTLFVRNG